MTVDREHVLLTVLGLNPRDARYLLNGAEETVPLAPVALYRLLPEPDRPRRVLALCTEQAHEQTLPMLREALGPSCPVEVVPVREDAADDAVADYLHRLTAAVPDEADLTVDVTHGLRHMPFLTYVGVLYLTALRRVRLRGAFYGMRNEPPAFSPFFDLRPLVELPGWFHAVRVLKDTGSAHVIAELVSRSDADTSKQVGPALRALAEAYGSALPIELGYLARRFLAEQSEPLTQVLQAQQLPLAHELVADLSEALATQQLRQEVAGDDWKTQVRLDRTELSRQAGIIDGLLTRRDFPTAFRLMREWLVLWAMWRTGQEQHWLEYRQRVKVEKLLHRLSQLAENSDASQLSPEQAAVGAVWGKLRELRNAYAHHGLDRTARLSAEDAPAPTVIDTWRGLLREVPETPLDLAPPAERRVLVSPVGMRPGALYSALRVAEPARVDLLLVVCSQQTRPAIAEACRAAGYGGEVVPVVLDDPLGGVTELDRRAGEAKPRLVDAAEVLVNITGGTTLMGVLVERIAKQAPRTARVHRFALVDRRSPGEQEADPYRPGEPCWLDDPPEAGR